MPRDDEPLELGDEDDRPRSRRKKRGLSPLAWVLVGLGGAALVCCGGLTAARLMPAPREGADPVDFADNTQKYKGQTVTLALRVSSSIFEGDSLRNYAGRPVQFRADGPKGEKVDVTVKMPAGELPNAKFGDPVLVTFVCSQGHLANGNDASKVIRR